jgi:Flp pilus assembly protein TadD
MHYCAALLVSLLLGACAGPPVAPPDDRLFHDRLFLAPKVRISADDVFAVSDSMRQFVRTELTGPGRTQHPQQALVNALRDKGQLRLEYDSALTRNAAQAFDARAGNCLSLVIMTAAFARELGLPIRYQRVDVDEIWSRSGDVYLAIAHVNLALGRRNIDDHFGRGDGEFLTIDFLPGQDLRRARTQAIGEQTIVAMYMNNRAAEALVDGQLDDAYAWARAAIGQDPGFPNAYNTLGAIYQRHGNAAEAEHVLAYALEREPRNTHVMSNLVLVLNDLGRVSEANALALKVAQLEPDPPFSFFHRGMAAVQQGNFTAARDLFATEVQRAPYYHEFHFWLAVAYVGLGDIDQARTQLKRAMELSSTTKDQTLYAAKLARINSYRDP